MTPAEWESICFLVEEWWPPNPAEGEFDEPRRKAWLLALDGFSAEEVSRAVKALLLRGSKWRPKVAEVVAEIRRDPSVPTFEEALALIRACLACRVSTAELYPDRLNEREKVNDELAMSEAGKLHPLVAPFMARQGGPHRLRGMGLWDEANEFREARRKQLRERWEEFCDVHEGREVAALASGGRRGEIGRLDPLAALGIESPVAEIEAGEGER